MRTTDRTPLAENSGLANRNSQKHLNKGKAKVYGKRAKTGLDDALDAFSKLQISPQETSKPTITLSPRGSPQKEDNSRPVPNYLHPLIVKCKTSLHSFDHFASRSLNHFLIEKLGEGSYGDVYGVHNSPAERSDPNTVLKIVPLRPTHGRGSRKHTSVQSLLSEYTISALMDEFPGFLRMRAVFLVDGHYPPALYKAYLDYKLTHGKCYNPDPTDPRSYPSDQVWAILEMEYAGIELEKLQKPTLPEIYDIFWTVAFSLGRAEEQVSFEHRDLHLSNVCYKKLRSPSAKRRLSSGGTSVTSNNSWNGDDDFVLFGASGLQTTIIDFTLSRATLEDGTVVFEDLERMAFEKRVAQTDEEHRQNKTYARMAEFANRRGKGNPKKLRWRHFNPASNVAWLSYLLATLLARNKNMKAEKSEAVLRGRLYRLLEYLEDATTKEEGWDYSTSSLIDIVLEQTFLSKGDVDAIIERLNRA